MDTSSLATSAPLMKNQETARRHVRDGAAFELTLLSLLGVGALSLCHELAIGLWVTILGAVVLRLRWRGERLPRAQLAGVRHK